MKQIRGITQRKFMKVIIPIDRECCDELPLLKVFTEDSSTVIFTGSGTETDPLIAEANVTIDPGLVILNSEANPLVQQANAQFNIEGPGMSREFVGYNNNDVPSFTLRTTNNPDIIKWGWNLANAETGSNVGSNLVLARYSDTGALIGNVIKIDRVSGNIDFINNISIGGIPLGSTYQQKMIVDNTITTVQTSVSLQAILAYQSKDAGFQVLAPNIIGGGQLYIKSTSTTWVSQPIIAI